MPQNHLGTQSKIQSTCGGKKALASLVFPKRKNIKTLKLELPWQKFGVKLQNELVN